MANPTKAELLTALSDAFDSVTASTSQLTDGQLVDCFDKMPVVAKTVSPTKGGIKVAFGNPA